MSSYLVAGVCLRRLYGPTTEYAIICPCKLCGLNAQVTSDAAKAALQELVDTAAAAGVSLPERHCC